MEAENEELDPSRAENLPRSVGRLENEDRSVESSSQQDQPTVAGEIGDAEDGNIKVRLIALENLVVALFAEAPERQSDLVREMAKYILPRPGKTPHRLTTEAARNMLALVERAAHYKGDRK